jgi:hypothetical protein
MNERQEAEWLYAKGLELAILLKGPSKKSVTETSVDKIIDDDYGDIAGRMAGRILRSENRMVADKSNQQNARGRTQ